MTKKLGSAVEWVLRRAPRFWAFTYFGLLLVSAVVYSQLPGRSFNDPNLPLEPSVRNDATQLRTSLTADLNRFSGPSEYTYEGKRAQLLSERVETVAKPPNEISTGVPISIRGESTTERSSASWVEWFLVSVIGEERRLADAPAQPIILVSAQPTGYGGVGSPMQTPLLPPAAVIFSSGQPNDELLRVTPATGRRLTRFYGAAQGDPTDASGDFWRMIYLSASTVTTLGMGDIQPLTPWARGLVTAEAVLGLILIGLFLNALALKAAGRRRREEQPSRG